MHKMHWCLCIESVLLLSFFSSIPISSAIRCFQCGSEAIFMDYPYSKEPLDQARMDEMENTQLTLESCHNLDYSFSSWGSYAVDCGPNQICAKTIIDDGLDERGWHRYFTGSKGCAMRNTSQGTNHVMGCGILKSKVVPSSGIFQDKMDLVCFCDEDYCNGAKSTKVPWMLLLSLIGLYLNH